MVFPFGNLNLGSMVNLLHHEPNLPFRRLRKREITPSSLKGYPPSVS